MTTTDSVESISGGPAKSPREVLNPPTSSPIHVVPRQYPCACVSRPLRDVTAGGPGQAASWHAVRGFRCRIRPVELPFAPGPGCTAHPRVHGSTFHINPSSWARVVPIPRLRLASPQGLPGEAARVAIAVRARALPHNVHDRFGREYQWGTCKELQRDAQSAHFVAQRCRWPRVVVEMPWSHGRCVSRPLRDVTVPLVQAAPAHGTRFQE